MSKQTIIIFIFLCCLLIVALLSVPLIKHFRSYPSNFGSSIDTPSDIDFSARLDKESGKPVLTSVIRNRSGAEIAYGQEYYIERKKDGEWFELADITGRTGNEEPYNPILHSLPAGKEVEFSVPLNFYGIFGRLPKENTGLSRKYHAVKMHCPRMFLQPVSP